MLAEHERRDAAEHDHRHQQRAPGLQPVAARRRRVLVVVRPPSAVPHRARHSRSPPCRRPDFVATSLPMIDRSLRGDHRGIGRRTQVDRAGWGSPGWRNEQSGGQYPVPFRPYSGGVELLWTRVGPSPVTRRRAPGPRTLAARRAARSGHRDRAAGGHPAGPEPGGADRPGDPDRAGVRRRARVHHPAHHHADRRRHRAAGRRPGRAGRHAGRTTCSRWGWRCSRRSRGTRRIRRSRCRR